MRTKTWTKKTGGCPHVFKGETQKAIELYIKYDKCAADVNHELGYPDRKTLTRWYKNYVRTGMYWKGYTRRQRSKYSLGQKETAVEYYLEHGQNLSRTVRALGYAALKYTGIYPMLPDPIQHFLSNCDYPSKREVLTVLAKLSEANEFSKATEALLVALEHGVSDTDSVVAMFSRLNSEILDLDPLVLPGSIPGMPQVNANVDEYDRLFLGRVGGHEN